MTSVRNSLVETNIIRVLGQKLPASLRFPQLCLAKVADLDIFDSMAGNLLFILLHVVQKSGENRM